MSKTYTLVGYFHPSSANWNYRVWLIVDETGSKLYRETFGGQYRMAAQLKASGIEMGETQVSELAEYKGRAVKRMPDIEEYRGRNY